MLKRQYIYMVQNSKRIQGEAYLPALHLRPWISPATLLLLSCGSFHIHLSLAHVPFAHPVPDTSSFLLWEVVLQLFSGFRLSRKSEAARHRVGARALLPLAAAPHYSGARPASPRPSLGRSGRGRGRGGSGGVSGGPGGGRRGAGARWRCESFAPAEWSWPAASRGGPPLAASCLGSGEQRRPFGEGPPRGGGCGVTGAGLRPGRGPKVQGDWGGGPRGRDRQELRRGRSAFPAGSRSRRPTPMPRLPAARDRPAEP